METIDIERMKELLRTKEVLEEKLRVNISIKGKTVTIEGSTADEFQALQILEAIDLGFSTRKAMSIMDEEIVYRKINIKDYTRRKNLHEVRARVIGTKGKTKRVIEEISGCKIVLKENTLGIIGPYDSIDAATTALKNIIRGSKQSNVYNYLETLNRVEKDEDLGLKIKENK